MWHGARPVRLYETNDHAARTCDHLLPPRVRHLLQKIQVTVESHSMQADLNDTRQVCNLEYGDNVIYRVSICISESNSVSQFLFPTKNDTCSFINKMPRGHMLAVV